MDFVLLHRRGNQLGQGEYTTMCWSLTASLAMVATGSAATAWTLHRKQPAAVPVAIGYFTIMEALQAASHLTIGACGDPANQLITLLSYLHIVFQPFVINAFAMQLIPGEVSQRIRRIVYSFCAMSSAVMLLQLVPLEWAGKCLIGQPLCGAELCVRQGTWHIAWDIPYNGLMTRFDQWIGLNLGFPTYLLTVLVMPFLYGAWRFALFHLVTGPVLANYLSKDINEIPAVWCLFSIAIILVAVLPRLLRQLRTERWFLWPEAWLPSPAR